MKCPCLNTDCPRHDNCVECKDYHKKKGQKTACEKLIEKKEEE